MTVVRFAFRAACFLGGWLAVCLLGGRALAPVRPAILAEKRDFLAGQASDFDTVFIGSSRVYRGIIPEVFDSELQAAGHRVRSFNLGMDGVYPPESLYWLREFLRSGSRARWVFIEILPIKTTIDLQTLTSLRSIRWHDWRHTVLVWRALAAEKSLSTLERALWSARHGELFLRQFSRLSRGSDWLALQLSPELQKVARKEYKFNTPWIPRAGFVPEPSTPMPAKHAATLRAEAAAIAGNLPTREPLPGPLRDELRILAAAVRQTGAEPIFFITPSVSHGEAFTDLRAQGIDADLISFKDPARYPALYDPAFHFDSSHLNEAGATELTRLLAKEFLTLHPKPAQSR